MQLQKNVANYLQSTASKQGCQVAELVRTGKQQVIMLLLAINQMAANAVDQKIICKEAVQAIANQKNKTQQCTEERIRNGVRPLFAASSQLLVTTSYHSTNTRVLAER